MFERAAAPAVAEAGEQVEPASKTWNHDSTSPSVMPYWVDRIRPHLVGAAEGIIAAGRELLAAKETLPHGAFGPLLTELGISPRTAQRLMRAASVLADATPVSHPPPASVAVLDVLARLDDDDLAAAIASGAVTASTTRADAVALVQERRNTHGVEDLQRAEKTIRAALDEASTLVGPRLARTVFDAIFQAVADDRPFDALWPPIERFLVAELTQS